jgi:hypothetical protein
MVDPLAETGGQSKKEALRLPLCACVEMHLVTSERCGFRSASVLVSSIISVIDMHLDNWVQTGLVSRSSLLGE